MSYKIIFLLFTYYFAIVQIAAQEKACRPLSVFTLDVTDDLILTWTSRSTENCSISHYLVTIRSRGEETVYTTEEMSMDVSFLPACEAALFTVIPVSTEDVAGAFHMLHLQMPVPRGANVTVEYLRVERQTEDRFLLTWELEEQWKRCTNRFRVVIYNEDYDDAEDIYVQSTSVLLEHIHPCEAYTFGVRAIHSLTKEGPISLMRYSTPSRRIAQPALQSLVLGTTSIDLKWQLETYERNRCEVSSIIIDALPHFSVAYPVRDNPERPIISTRITSLLADTMYFFNVTVINTAGPSVPFLTAVQTLPDN